MKGGVFNKVLRIDLTSGKIEIESYSDDKWRKYLGGSGLGVRILYDETDENTDPLGPENPLIFLTGPLVGTTAPNFGRFQVITKSPLTGGFGESNCGGTWGHKLKRAGYDGIIFTGKADKPVYINIDEDKVDILDACDIWGKDSVETDLVMKNRHGGKTVTCCIGPAGERLVKIAAIMTDGKDGRAAGRCGVGAVMGSKNVKAIAVNGSLQVPLADPDVFKESVKEWAPKISEIADPLLANGTSGGFVFCESEGELPIKNWIEGNLEGAENISGPVMTETILTGRYNCAQCVIKCGRVVHVKEGKYASDEGGGPEYETLGMLGSNCMITDLAAVQMGNELCNRFGLDTISTGACVSFTMEAYEQGLVSESDLGGIMAEWGDADAMIALIKKIAYREDFGDILAEGTRFASEKIGGKATEMAVQIRGLDFPAHDPRAIFSTALQYATSARGACHLSSFTHDLEYGAEIPPDFNLQKPGDRFTQEGRPEFIAGMQNIMGLFDSLTGCKFMIFGMNEKTLGLICEWLNSITGWDMTIDELVKTGERIFNLKRMYNVRLGQSRKDDILPPRMLNLPRNSGGAEGKLPDLEPMLDGYYKFRRWDNNGIPTDDLLKELELK